MSAVELYREPGGRWRWAYRESATTKALPSNEDYADVGAARAAAAAAYPGVPIADAGSVGDAGEERRPGRAGGLARKAAGWLTPVVVLIAWSRSRRR